MQNQVVRSAGILYFLIKKYIPSRWEYNTSTETFKDELLPTILENIKYDIVSTSSESQSSSLENASKLTTQMEDNTI